MNQGVLMKTSVNTLIALVLLIGPIHATAQTEGHLNVTTVVHKEEVVVGDNGERRTKLVDATKVVPGDEVVYTVTFENIGSEPADDIVITNPLPAEMTYVEGSAFGPGSEIVFSTDGGKSFAPPEKLLVTDEQGAERRAVPEEYTHIRWIVREQIRAGAQGVARFRATLN